MRVTLKTRAAVAEGGNEKMKESKKALTVLKGQGIVLAMIVVFAVFGILSKAVNGQNTYATLGNFMQILQQNASLGIMACGMTFVIIGGNFDLTHGSLLTLLTCICVNQYRSMGPVGAMLVTFAVAIVMGCLSGFLVGYLKLNSMIVTLGMMNVLSALALMYTGGKNVSFHDKKGWFKYLGNGNLFGIPYPVIIMIVFIIIFGIMLTKTVYGKQVMATGGNQTASNYSGVNSKKVIMMTFVISAVTVALGSVLMAARNAQADSTMGQGLEFDVIAGVILGGASLDGGAGSVYKSFVGIMILGMLKAGFVNLGLPAELQYCAQCVIILIAVYFDIRSQRKKVEKA